MTAIWPDSLPLPTRAGYGQQRMDGRMRKSAETGPPGYRRRYSSNASAMSLVLLASRAQKATFDVFWDETLSAGSLPFLMADPVSNDWPLLTSDGKALLTHDGAAILVARQLLCLMGEAPPSETLRGVTFEIGFAIVVMP